jgi:Leucine-rich repeat (LRR) protein
MQLRFEGKLISEFVVSAPNIDDQTVDVDVVETYALDYMPLSFAQNLTCSRLLAAKRPVVELLWDEKTFELARMDMDHFVSEFTLNNNTLTYSTTVRYYYGHATWPRLFEKDASCFEVALESDCMVSPWVHPGRALRFPVMRFRGGHSFDHGWAENMPKSLVELDVCGGSTTYAFDANFRTSLNIQRLRLSKLRLSFVWSSIFKLLNLTALDLSDNDLRIIPSELGRLTELEHLDLSNNPKLSGSLHLATCTKLKELNVLGCAFGLDDFRLGDLLVLIIR